MILTSSARSSEGPQEDMVLKLMKSKRALRSAPAQQRLSNRGYYVWRPKNPRNMNERVRI